MSFERYQINQFNGCSILVNVGELPNPDSCNRLLLLIKHTVDASSSKRARKSSNYAIGSLVDAEVNSFHV